MSDNDDLDLSRFDTDKYYDPEKEKQVPESDIPPLPEGTYELWVKKIEKKVSAAGNNYLSVWLVDQDTRTHDSYVFETIMLSGPDAAVDRGKAKLASLCKSCGVPKPQSTKDLLDTVCTAMLGIEPAKGQYSAKNVVLYYVPREMDAPEDEQDSPDLDDDLPF